MPHKVYIHDGGGGGDIPANQFKCHRGWGYLEEFKKKFPDSKILVVVTSCSAEGVRYIKYNPYIDEVKELPWVNPNLPWKGLAPHVEGYEHLNQAAKRLMPEAKPKVPPVYLSDEDKVAVDEIVKQGKFCFVHPFAGTPERMAYPLEHYPKLIDRIIDELGHNVVVIGGSYKQLANQGMKEKLKIEEFKYERPGLINIVNKTNMRQGIRLAQEASLWVGTWSCYVWPGYNRNSRMAIVMPAGSYRGVGVINKVQQKMIRIPRKETNYSKFEEQIINHLKG